ncbi:5-(carboxyamino)imidazole ribonucleotide synthase [Marinilactibacillus sp. 15R]|uniref:5-(carboxyamino)imidazole ribonucleotide synthase n=1 Tax=Marinilactibacillus sp. 15R TaxID=1911586 RepID=UPI000909B065|nr:5-(carboxyamino)imidazole ribonucleotide synthase [Marinilactibacillus sp. 15R]API88574.1 5-(carboxyamino)imidazole ribonucleotide synthase [Marinilactibacillus sp. 15R]
MSNLIEPGSTIGIIGGGQLGRMMAFSAKERGYKIAVLDPTKNCPTAQVADHHIEAAYNDAEALNKLAEISDVLTYEFENVDASTIKKVIDQVRVPQGTNLLLITQNRLKEKEFLKKSGIPVAAYAKIKTVEELNDSIQELGYPAVLKTVQGGYDGKGQYVLKTKADISEAALLLENGICILEKWVEFEKEVSIMVTRNERGHISTFPVSENIHQNNILLKSIIPARVSEKVQEETKKIAEKIAEKIQLVGVLGIELFITKDEDIYANELAPRPHNSGHYSIEACSDSQFDMHIRAICGYSLPKVELLKSAVMVNILGEHLEKSLELNESKPSWHVHDYGKADVKIGRKMGHITILTDNIDKTLKEVNETKIW